MSSINDLDNPLLVLILNKLCIQKLFTAGHVCVRWNAMRDMSLSERKELVLLIGENAQSCIDESVFTIPEQQVLVDGNGKRLFPDIDQSSVQLQIHSFPIHFARVLCSHFYYLTSLTISTRVSSDELNSISHLLEQFNRPKGTLHTFKLYGSNKPNLSQNIWSYLRLLRAINSIGSLRKLVFDVTVKDWKFPRIDLPMMAQLEEFEFNGSDVEEHDFLYDSIEEHAEHNRKLKRFGINFQLHNFSWLLRLRYRFLSNFTHLHIHLSNGYHPFQNLCPHFTGLTSLEITFRQERFSTTGLFRPLTHLPNLLSLTVNISGCSLTPLPLNQRGIMHFELSSVKVFTINISGTIRSHSFFHNCNMNRVFPNVQVVRVIRESSTLLCCKCWKAIDPKKSDTSTLGKSCMHCVRHMFRHFTHSQHLRMVCAKLLIVPNMIVPWKRQWVWSEMKPFKDEEEDVVDEEVVEEDD